MSRNQNMRVAGLIAATIAMVCAVSHTLPCSAAEPRTTLIIEGGGLLPNNDAVYERLLAGAKVNGRPRIGYLPTASFSPENVAKGFARFRDRIVARGISPDDIELIDITLDNAAKQASDPAVLAQIRGCGLIFFGGGDQTRITRALQPNGNPTPALQAIFDVWAGGGLIAGTSAGAAMQSAAMITVSGLPGDSLDEGFNALDFGLTKAIEQPARRGLLVSPGLGFFKSGIVDQHFNQRRGRLGRLARAAIEEKIRFGFGIDENTALAVQSDGTLEVLGEGSVMIVDTAGATCQDGPLGCTLSGVHLSCLQQGDRFDPKTGEAAIHPGKKPMAPGKETNNGNFLIPDIAGRGAVLDALFPGLAKNTARRQVGVTLQHHSGYAHGYRFTFAKTDQTIAYEGTVNGLLADAVTHVRLDIEPVANMLASPKSALPRDIVDGPAGPALKAVWFRGIMLADERSRFRPQDPLTRGELAIAIAQTIHLEPVRSYPPSLTDVPTSHPAAADISLVVGAGLMMTQRGVFRPDERISRQEAAAVLVRLAERYRSEVLPEGGIL